MISTSYKTPMIVAALLIAALLVYGALTMQDRRTTSQKINDAIEALPQGADKAARQLEDRTPGQRLGDDVKDMGDKIKDKTQPAPNN